jgi:hypothetical protein
MDMHDTRDLLPLDSVTFDIKEPLEDNEVPVTEHSYPSPQKNP